MKITNDTSAVITGAASGLGMGVARALAVAGARTALLDMNIDAGEALAAELNGIFIKTDVSDSTAVTKALAQSRNIQGQERICVNCAGVAPAMKTVARGAPHDPELFARTVAINLIGSFNTASQCAAGMVASAPLNSDGERGVIVNTASVAAFDGQIGQAAYSASKGGIAGLTLPMARDLADKGIRVMAIAPGIFGTPMVRSFPQEVQDALAAQIPFPQRLGAAEEFAGLVMHIIDNPMLNGEVIRLDGAIRMGPR